MQLRLKLISDLFPDQQEQEVLIRDDVPVQQIVAEIQHEYNLAEASYSLQVYETGKRLDLNRTLAQQPPANSALLFAVEKLAVTADPIDSTLDSTLHGDTPALHLRLRADNGQVFVLSYFPALIGRPNPQQQLPATMLALDLTPIDPSQTSSRPHARIKLTNNAFSIESIRGTNPVFVNERAVSLGQSRTLAANDRLRFGKVILVVE